MVIGAPSSHCFSALACVRACARDGDIVYDVVRQLVYVDVGKTGVGQHPTGRFFAPHRA
jgi:hypothetical protein